MTATVMTLFYPHAVTASVVITGPESPSELDNISIECSIRANPRAEITWLLVKVSLTEAARILSGPRISIIENDQATNILQIAKVTAADNGVYVCEADNGIGSPGTGMWDLRIISELHYDCVDYGSKYTPNNYIYTRYVHECVTL